MSKKKHSHVLLCTLSLLFPLHVVSQNVTNPYCEIETCHDPENHLMCVIQDHGFGDSCMAKNALDLPKLTRAEKVRIVRTHNDLRNSAANGGQARGFPHGLSVPVSENMRLMTWSKELAHFAQRWANQCTPNKTTLCVHTNSSATVGHLTFVLPHWDVRKHGMELEFLSSVYAKAVIESADVQLDVKHPEKTLRSSVLMEASPLKNMVQFLWATADEVGCGRSFYDEGYRTENKTALIVCFYNDGPARGGPMYDEGEPCSKCKCSFELPGLCARTARLDVARKLLLVAALCVWSL